MSLLFLLATMAMSWRAYAKSLRLLELMEQRHPYVWMWLGHPGIFDTWKVVSTVIADSNGKSVLPAPVDAEMHALAKAIRRDGIIGACLMLISIALG